MTVKNSFLVLALTLLFAATAGAAPVLTVACALSDSCPMMPRQEPHDCHEEGSSAPVRDCCESTEAPVPSHQCSRIAAPEAALSIHGPLATVPASPSAGAADFALDVPYRACGPPLLALLGVLLI